MEGLPLRHFDQAQGPAVEFPAADIDPVGGLDTLRADLDPQTAERFHLRARQRLDSPVIGDAAEKDAAARVGESGQLVSQIVPGTAGPAAAGELDLLETPATVLTQLQLLPDLLVPHSHATAPRRDPHFRPIPVSYSVHSSDSPRKVPRRARTCSAWPGVPDQFLSPLAVSDDHATRCARKRVRGSMS